MMDDAQLRRYDHNWDIAFVIIIISIVLSFASQTLRAMTVSSIPKENTVDGHRSVLADWLSIASFVSVLRAMAYYYSQTN